MQVVFIRAKKHEGMTNSNPSVGCVVVKNGFILSSGTTEIGGRPHAENIALSMPIDFSGADLFVTLEPCNHFGKTPPCTQAIINAGIKRVFVGVKDEDKRVQGNGLDSLKIAGIEVCDGVLGDDIKEFYKPYLFAKSFKCPFVTGKIVCSQDGKIATKTGASKWISDPKSREFTNFLRHKYEGILVGGETYRKDLPLLNCRALGLEKFSPQRFVLSNSLQNIEGFQVVKGNFSEILPLLYKEFGVNHLLIEGGAGVITKAIKEDAINELLVCTAPIFIGQDGKNCFAEEGILEIANAKKFKIKRSFMFGKLNFTILQK